MFPNRNGRTCKPCSRTVCRRAQALLACETLTSTAICAIEPCPSAEKESKESVNDEQGQTVHAVRDGTHTCCRNFSTWCGIADARLQRPAAADQSPWYQNPVTVQTSFEVCVELPRERVLSSSCSVLFMSTFFVRSEKKSGQTLRVINISIS